MFSFKINKYHFARGRETKRGGWNKHCEKSMLSWSRDLTILANCNFKLYCSLWVYLLPGSVVSVKDEDGVLWLLRAPELLSLLGVSRLLDKLGGVMTCRLSREQLAERLEEDLRADSGALAGFRGVLSASLSASVSARSFMSSSEPSESLSRLLSDSAGNSSVTDEKQVKEQK